MERIFRAALIGLMLTCFWAGAKGQDPGYQRFTAADGTVIEYRLTAPQPEQESYPVLLALPPGPQTPGTVDWGWRNLYLQQAKELGWVVVSPAVPADRPLYFQGSQMYLPELMKAVSTRYRPEGGKYYLAGVSNGGLAAFRVAVEHPELFHCIAVLPGWPAPSDLERIDRIAAIPVKMWAGENEHPTRLDLMRRAQQAIGALGGQAELEILSGQGHNLPSLRGGRQLFDYLEKSRTR